MPGQVKVSFLYTNEMNDRKELQNFNYSYMNTADIDQLVAEKENPCISIIIPTHRYSSERRQDPKNLEKAASKAKSLLQHSAWPKEKILSLTSKIDSVLQNIDYIRHQDGLAVFVSPAITKYFLLPFPVTEKILLGKNFELKDLIYYSQFLTPYYLLAVSKKKIRLFRGEGRDIQEVHNDDFPKQYVESYEYSKPSRASSFSQGLKDYELDKSEMQELRQKNFFKEVDDSMSKYLKKDMPLLVAGVEEELTNFEHVSRHVDKVVGIIHGNFDHDAVHPLAETAWKKINEYIKSQQKNLINQLQEGIGTKLTADGLRDVWKMAKQGNALNLVVERDYHVTAYVDPADDSRIYLGPPAGNYEILSDAVDQLMLMVKEKGGNVVIVENGELANFNHIAMQLRYAV